MAEGFDEKIVLRTLTKCVYKQFEAGENIMTEHRKLKSGRGGYSFPPA